MSGEAGAGRRSTYFQIYFSSGMTISVAMPPDVENNPHYISNYFKEASIPFEDKLNEVLPTLDKIVEQLIQEQGIPIIAFDPKADYVQGVIIEDTDEHKTDQYTESQVKNWFANSKNPKVFLSFSFPTKSFSKITLSITINQRILRSQLNMLADKIALIFE
ncbi:hypothetical protein [Aquimarina sp. 2304DJ70-9]|uniref:hypothetical protein n=1 Tax=Aquimarina penaris TaxID=3231044 RepID=UPI0034624F72